MKKITRILKALEKAAREMIRLQKNYDKHKWIEPSPVTGRALEFYDTDYFPAKMQKFYSAGHGYFTSWHWFSDRFYDSYNRLNNKEQAVFISNISKYTHLFATVKAGYLYNFPRIYEEWGYETPDQNDYWIFGVFHEEEYERDLEEDKKKYLFFANIKLKENIDILEDTIRTGYWADACPGHHKVSRMKHNPW